MRPLNSRESPDRERYREKLRNDLKILEREKIMRKRRKPLHMRFVDERELSKERKPYSTML